jgi:hypothetical protein
MKVFNLQCDQGHGFEGWFGSEDDFHDQVERSMLECPLCASKAVRRLPSAPRLNLAHAEPLPPRSPTQPAAQPAVDSLAPLGSTPQHQAVQALWLKAVQHVMAHTEDVGAQFADEARRIHYGETPERGIRGQTTPEETQALQEEGIEVFSLPVPTGLKGPLQ